MKRYLFVKHYSINEKGVIQTDTIEEKYLLDVRDGICEAIIDTQNQTYFDADNNEWKKIENL